VSLGLKSVFAKVLYYPFIVSVCPPGVKPKPSPESGDQRIAAEE